MKIKNKIILKTKTLKGDLAKIYVNILDDDNDTLFIKRSILLSEEVEGENCRKFGSKYFKESFPFAIKKRKF